MTVPDSTQFEPVPGNPEPAAAPDASAAQYRAPQYPPAAPAYGTPQYGTPQYPPAAPQYADAPYPYPAQPGYGYGAQQYASPKNLLAATLLCFFLGPLGLHRFYVGKVGTGIAQLLTAGGLGVWALIDFIMLLCQAFKDSDGYTLRWDTVH